jgi:CheY-like chemotaxis protein
MDQQSVPKPVILWVDDDADDAALFLQAFRVHQNKHELVQVGSAEEALLYLREKGATDKPALIVLDINMPVMNGMQLLTELKGNPSFRGVPVVMVSTSLNAEDQAFCERYHVMIIEKPDSIMAIEKMVQQLVGVAL